MLWQAKLAIIPRSTLCIARKKGWAVTSQSSSPIMSCDQVSGPTAKLYWEQRAKIQHHIQLDLLRGRGTCPSIKQDNWWTPYQCPPITGQPVSKPNHCSHWKGKKVSKAHPLLTESQNYYTVQALRKTDQNETHVQSSISIVKFRTPKLTGIMQGNTRGWKRLTKVRPSNTVSAKNKITSIHAPEDQFRLETSGQTRTFPS